MTAATLQSQETTRLPDMKVSVRQVFGIDSDLEVPAYSEVDPHVPDVDPDYRFDRATTLAIRWVVGFSRARREKTMAQRLAAELMDAANGLGASVKRRDDLQKMAESNKAFAHYRW